jgi:hypothetical protein
MENTGLVFKMYTDLTNYSKGLKKAGGELNQFNGLMKGIAAGIATAFSVDAILSFGKSSMQAYDISAKGEASLLAALKGRVDVQKTLTTQAAKLQTSTLFDDDATIEAQKQLAVFDLAESQIKTLLPLIQDFATVNKTDLSSAAMMVAKSIGTSKNALKSYGISIDSTMSKAEKASEIQRVFNERYGGQAEIAASVGSGAMVQLNNAFGDFQEIVGKLLSQNTQGFFKGMANELGQLNSHLNSETLSNWDKFVSGASKLAKYADSTGLLAPAVNLIVDEKIKETEGTQKLITAIETLNNLRKHAKQLIADEVSALQAKKKQDEADAITAAAKNKAYLESVSLIGSINTEIARNEDLIKQANSEQKLSYYRNQNELLKKQLEYYNGIGTSLAKMTPKGAGQISTSGSSSMALRTGATVNTNYGTDAPSLVELQETAQQASEMLSYFREDILATAAEGFGLLISGDMGLGDFFKSILMLTADFAKQFGKMLISIGLAKISLEKLGISGIGAVVAGFALIAAASAIGGLLSNAGNMQGLATGTNYVPQEGPYYLHKGEAVVPAKYNPGAGGQMPSMIRVVGAISGRDIRLTQAREGYYNSRTTGR